MSWTDEMQARRAAERAQLAETALAVLPVLAARLRGRERERCERYHRMLARAPLERRGEIAAALALAAYPELAPGQRDHWREQLLPLTAYSAASARVRARLVLGETPAEISGGLTAREAHEWLLDGPHLSAAEWLLDRAGHAGHTARSIRVARWLIAVLADPPRADALRRARVEHGPAGVTIEGSYLDRVDELTDRDLVTSVEGTFRRAAKRLAAQNERALRRESKPLAGAPRWWRPVRCARLLTTGPALTVEGRELRHCVGQYAAAVRARRSTIVALDVLGQRSTAELCPRTARVVQHKGAANASPPELCVRALRVLERRWQAAAGGAV